MSATGPVLNGAAVLPPMEVDSTDGLTRHVNHKAKKQAASRFAVLNAFIDGTMEELCRGDIVVWLVLYRDTRNGTAQTSQIDIARRAGLSTRGVRGALGRLKRRGLVRCVYKGGLNRGPSRYKVIPTEEPIGAAVRRKLARRG